MISKKSFDAMVNAGKNKMETCRFVDAKGNCWGAKKKNGKPVFFKPSPTICMVCPVYEMDFKNEVK